MIQKHLQEMSLDAGHDAGSLEINQMKSKECKRMHM